MKKALRSATNYTISKASSIYARLFGRPCFKNLNKIIFMASAKGLGVMNCESTYASGEQLFARKFIEKFDSSEYIVFDIGANTGTFTETVLSGTKFLKVISVEPHPKTSKVLDKNMHKFSDRHRTIDKGVSNTIGQATLYDYAENKGSSHASLYKESLTEIHGSKNFTKLTIDLTTIDEICKEVNERVCLIKIDTEGHELKALQGCSNLLQSKKKPSAFLLEFNEMNIFSKTTMHDIKNILSNYVAHRILPGGRLIDISTEATIFTELYAYQNIVFVNYNEIPKISDLL